MLKIILSKPLNLNDSFSVFIEWCNKYSINNPFIIIDTSYNIIDILHSIYILTSYITAPDCRTVRRKMEKRHQMTGFPLTIITKCSNSNCSEYILCTRNIFSNRAKYMFCKKCRKDQDKLSNLFSSFSLNHIDHTDHTDHTDHMVVDS